MSPHESHVLDLLVRGGQVVTPSGVGTWDVGAKDGRVAAVAMPGTLPSDGVPAIDASQKIVMPGGVERRRAPLDSAS